MTKFSERIGVVKPSDFLQIDSMNDALKNSLWNVIYTTFGKYGDSWVAVAKIVAKDYKKEALDRIPDDVSRCEKWMNELFYKLEWHEVYDLLEFLIEKPVKGSIIIGYGTRNGFYNLGGVALIGEFNRVLDENKSGYQFISGVLSSITNQAEASSVADAANLSKDRGFGGAHEHIKKALSFLGPKPDYHNAIKEAISAVESVVKKISEKGSATFGDALKIIDEKIKLHPAMKEAFNKLYGYTSDEKGIRHAMLDDNEIAPEDARYMVISCSAFVHFLIIKAERLALP